MLRLLTQKSMSTWPVVEEGEVVCHRCLHGQSDTHCLFDELRRFLCHNRCFGGHLIAYEYAPIETLGICVNIGVY
jgi:hypothetical protein